MMQKLVKKIWIQKRLPKEWTGAIIYPVYKKGNRSDYDNYRSIALVNTAYKLVM